MLSLGARELEFVETSKGYGTKTKMPCGFQLDITILSNIQSMEPRIERIEKKIAEWKLEQEIMIRDIESKKARASTLELLIKNLKDLNLLNNDDPRIGSYTIEDVCPQCVQATKEKSHESKLKAKKSFNVMRKKTKKSTQNVNDEEALKIASKVKGVKLEDQIENIEWKKGPEKQKYDFYI